jgi:peptidoglycan/xylan/chitin deacetylase (PgdA/CDA1 family)
MVGDAAKKYPDVVRQVAERGHVIGNHSWDHPSFPLISGRQRRRQIRACASTIWPYGGERLFRPPFGHQSLASRLDAWWLRYQVVTWSVVAEDWSEREVSWMVARLVERIKPGSIIVLHDAIYRSIQPVPQYDRERMLRALDLTLDCLGDRFRFVTVPELLRHGRPRRRYWAQQVEPQSVPLLSEYSLLRRDPLSR